MNHRKVGYARISLQCFAGNFARYQLSFAQRHQHVIQFIIVGDLCHTLTIRAIGKNQQFVFGADGGADSGLHAISPATLQEDGCIVGLIQSSNCQQVVAEWCYDTFVIIFVPSAPVLQHGMAYAFRSAQGTGCQ